MLPYWIRHAAPLFVSGIYRGGYFAHRLTLSRPPTQAEVPALRDKCEELADDVRALGTLVHALWGALVAVGVVKGGV